MSSFYVVGSEIALSAGAGYGHSLIMGVITATFGGIIRDILGGDIPIILRKEIYAIAVFAGRVVFAGVWAIEGPGIAAILADFVACFAALIHGWSLPVYRV